MSKIFFMGGMLYDASIDTHRAFTVKPGHSDVAYTADTPSERETLWGLCKHHSHMYSLTKGDDFAILYRTSWEASSCTEVQPVLEGDAVDEVRRVKWGQ